MDASHRLVEQSSDSRARSLQGSPVRGARSTQDSLFRVLPLVIVTQVTTTALVLRTKPAGVPCQEITLNPGQPIKGIASSGSNMNDSNDTVTTNEAYEGPPLKEHALPRIGCLGCCQQ